VVAAYEELVRPRVMTAVEDLAAREASGVLEVTGDPSGAIYLDGGQIAFARASWVPGLAARLRTVAPGLGALAEMSSGRDSDDAAIAGQAVQRGYLTPDGLHELIRSIVVDAFLVLTIPLTADSRVAAIRSTSASCAGRPSGGPSGWRSTAWRRRPRWPSGTSGRGPRS
jgi:hypothetical protein